jgi:DNA replication ATP-dependent helicase Dna2
MSEPETALLKRLRALVEAEADEQREQLERQWSQPLANRVYTGTAIEGLDYNGVDDRGGYLVFTCATNNSRFRQGDILFLHRGPNPLEADYAEGTVEIDDESRLEISLQSGNLMWFTDAPEEWIADEGYRDMSGYYLDALREVGTRACGRERILPMLRDALRPKIDLARFERARESAAAEGLNDRQIEAVAYAYATDLAHLIQGPPGTGKTFVLAHIARLLVEEGERVLVTALTHRAINNALNEIARLDASLAVGKIGQDARRDGLDAQVPNAEYFEASPFAERAGGYVIGATPFATQTRRLAEVEFDTVLFDEASQITLPLAIMGMLPGRRYVFIGDHKQLPPVSILPERSALSNRSIFEYLAGRGYRTQLNLTYRLNDELTVWPRRTFYDHDLQPAPGIGARRLVLGETPPRWRQVLGPGRSAVLIDVDQANTTTRSRKEADIVVDLVLALLAGGLAPEQVGVISPYRAQGREIRNRLRRRLPSEDVYRAIVVDTVERMQGQQRDVVLVSLGTSSVSFAERLSGFFFQPQRLNVTVTRPKLKLVIVGSSKVGLAVPANAEHAAWVDLFNDLLRSCARIPLDSTAGHTWPS